MSDFSTDDLRVKATERYSFGRTDYRAGLGTTNRMLWPAEWHKMYRAERKKIHKALWRDWMDMI